VSEEDRKFPVAGEGWVFILPLLGVTAVLWGLHLFIAAAVLLPITLFVISFFRDPHRAIPPGEKNIVSPADGKVLYVGPCRENAHLGRAAIKVSIFMSPLNVHVNRIPLTGRIARRSYSPGKYFCANLDKASLLNERNALVVENAEGARVLFIQIAGFIARRIVCRVNEGDAVVRGRRFGMIRFGSRMDVYLPEDTRILVRPGEKTFAGSTVLGVLP
jgi:phosphatidylserine decarboxylase